MTTARIAFWGTVLIAIAQGLYYTPKLPAKVATHFGAGGQPDGWQTPNGFLVFHLFMIGVMVLSFGVLPVFLRRAPDTFINIPNKKYWLAPERRAETLVSMTGWLLWMGAATMAFLVLVVQQLIQANLNPPPELGAAFWPLFIGFMAATAVWTVALYRRFSRPDSRD